MVNWTGSGPGIKDGKTNKQIKPQTDKNTSMTKPNQNPTPPKKTHNKKTNNQPNAPTTQANYDDVELL